MMRFSWSQTGGPSLTISDASADVGETVDLDVTLTDAPSGLAGYAITATITNPDVASFTTATFPNSFGIATDESPPDDSSEITLKAVDIDNNISAPTGEIPLATLHVRAEAGGETKITPNVLQMDDDAGQAMSPLEESASLNVGSSTPTTTQTTVPEPGHDYQRGTQQEIDLGWKRVYVVKDIPGLDSSKVAVTSTDYELLHPETAFDGLWTYQYLEIGDSRDIYRGRIDYAKSQRESYKMREFVSRAAEIGMNLLAAYAFAGTGAGIPAAVSITVDMLTDSIAWASDAVNEPYKQAFTQMAGSGANMRFLDQHLTEVQTSGQFPQSVEGIVDASVEVFDHLQRAENVIDAWNTFVRGLQHADSPASGLFYKGAYTQAVKSLQGFFIGLAISTASAAVEGWFRDNAKIAGLMHAYHSSQIPILEELIEYEEKALTGRLNPPDILRYHSRQFAHDQMGAYAHSQVSKFFEAMVGEEFDLVNPNDWAELVDEPLEILQNPAQKASLHHNNAVNYRQSSVMDFAGLGASVKDAQESLARSINYEVVQGQGGD